MGETLFVAGKLRLNSNPFDAGDGNGRLGRPLQKALGEVIRQIGLETPVIVVPGSTGTGKTLLANMAERVCADMGLTIRRSQRGDFVEIADGQRSDVLLVDEADAMPDSTLHALLFEGEKRLATTTVLLCLPASVRRFSTVGDVVVVELARLSQSDTRHYLQVRATHAGFPDLFTPAAFDLIVDGSRGVPRQLWSIASLAYFYAASRGASQIGREHVAHALASQIPHPEMPNVAVPAAAPIEPVTETPVREPVASTQRMSANVAVFKRGNSPEPPAPQMRHLELKEALAGSTSTAVTPAEGAEIRTSDPIPWPMSDLQKSIASALNRSAAADELLINEQKAESPKGSMGFALDNVATERGEGRRPPVVVGVAAGVVVALAAGVALMFFVDPRVPSETAAVATVTAPAVNQPTSTPAKPANAVGQTIDKGGAANRTAGPSNTERFATNPSSTSPRTATTRAGQRTRRTRAEPIPASPSPVTSPAPAATAMVVPPEDEALNAARVRAEAAAADAVVAAVAQRQAENARTAKQLAAQAAASREADARDAANRASDLARAAAKAQADKEAKERARTFDFKPHYLLYQ